MLYFGQSFLSYLENVTKHTPQCNESFILSGITFELPEKHFLTDVPSLCTKKDSKHPFSHLSAVLSSVPVLILLFRQSSGKVYGKTLKSSASAIFFHNPVHLRLRFLHVADQLELGAASVEILSLAMNFEIGISVQIIRQEAHPALESHHYRSHRKHFLLVLCHKRTAFPKESPGIAFKQSKVEIHLT